MIQFKTSRLSWRPVYLALTFIVATTFNPAFLPRRAAAVAACDDVQFIFARGSGEKLNDGSFRAWQSNIETTLSDSELHYSFYELGTSAHGGYQYPAVRVSDDAEGFHNLVGAALSAGTAFAFGNSVAQGKGELKAYLEQVSNTCPQTRFVLGGYSQGAMLISTLLPELDANQIIYVTTFGDPKLYLPEGEPKAGLISRFFPDACKGLNLSPYRIYVPDCRAYEGVLGSVRPYQAVGYSGKIGTWCNKSDIMCSSGLSVDDHIAYVSEQLYLDAANHIRQAITKYYDEQLKPAPATSPHDLVFIFDTTKSMDGLIDQYREEAKNLATQVYAQDGRVALYEFRDLNSNNFQPRLLCDFSCDQETLFQQLDQLNAADGGDYRESLLSAVMTAMNTLKWHNGATKTAVILTDATYHNPDYDGTTEPMVVQRSLEIDPVNLYVIAPPRVQPAYHRLTSATGGQAFSSANDLKLSTSTILHRPVAKLALPTYSGFVGETFQFDASASYSTNSTNKTKLSYDWDLNGDGVFEIQNGAAIVQQTYVKSFQGLIQVRVRDGEMFSTMSARVDVQSNPPQAATITQLTATPLANYAVQVNFRTNAEQVLVIIDDAVVSLNDVHTGSNQFTINDVTKIATLTLVPYLNQTRGLPQTITIEGSDHPTPSPLPTSTIKPPLPYAQVAPAAITAPTTGVHV